MSWTPIFFACLAFSCLSFIYYGLGCLFAKRIRLEFERYELARFRNLVGGLQITGSLGLIGGLWLPLLGCAAASGLAILMLLGLIVRKRLRDKVIQMVPAGGYLVVNTVLAVSFYLAYTAPS